MRKYNLYLSILLAAVLLLPATDISAARKRKGGGNPDITSFIDVYGGAGYSSLLHSIPDSKVPGGGAGMIGVGYFMKHKSKFEFRTGLEFMFLNSSTMMNNLDIRGKYNYTHPGTSVEMDYYMDFSDYKNNSKHIDYYTEQHNRLSVGLPVMFGAQFSRYYFLVGAKVNMGVLGMYSTKSPMKTYLVDPTLIDNLENMPNHGLYTSDVRSNGSINFGLDVTGSAEFGICLDEWMPSKALTIQRGRSKMPVSYRIGLFADYGFLNVNNSNVNNPIYRFYNADGAEIQPDANGSYSLTLDEAHSVKPRSIFDSDIAKDENGRKYSVNPLVVGAKFSVLFQVSPKPKPVKKRPRPRPRPKEVNTVPDPNFFYCMVSDYETEKPLDAKIVLFNLDGKRDTVLKAESDATTGFFQQEMKNMYVGIKVTREGYIDYSDTLFQILSDTVYVDLQPIQKNTIVILNNLFFDTDKTVIRNISAQSLDDLYQLLVKNPEMRIRITGHTDNVGSRNYNMKLSRGRAKAVYDEMVKRGIDPSRMEAVGRGPLDPISDNDTPEGRAENRRVEFMIL